ncbi:MAG: ABC transporter ATP-binding protein [Rubricoccaceae bacterium]|nr:ABC transporter ATP-binding protein [Rubricoccaceae bacterium]
MQRTFFFRLKRFLTRLRFIVGADNLSKFGSLFAAALGMATLQVIGVASLLPFLKLVTEPELIETNEMVGLAYDVSGAESVQAFLILAGVAVLVLIAFSSAFTVFTFALQYRVVQGTTFDIERRMLRHYINKEYIYFLVSNTSNMAKQLLTEVSHFSEYLLMQLVLAVVHTFMVLFIFTLVFVVNPVLALVTMAILGGSYFLAYSRIRGRLLTLGGARIEALDARFKTATEALSGVKTVKALDCAPYFLRQFSDASGRYHDSIIRYQTLKVAPSYLVQSIAFGGVVAIILYLLAADQTMDDIIPILGLYAAAGYKLLPSLRTLFNALSLVRYNHPMVDQLYRDLGGLDDPPAVPVGDDPGAAAVPFDEALELRGVTFAYPNAEAAAVRDVTLRIERGTRVAFAGSTGSGKTTLVDIVMSLIKPIEGDLLVDGTPITEANDVAWRRTIGYVPQDVFVVDDTVAKNIAFGIPDEEVDLERVREAARTARLHDFIVQELPEQYGTKVGERGNRLSGGQRQRLGLARALYRRPSLLILDEATSALDGVTQESVMQALNELPERVTILAIAHRLSTVKSFDTIYLMDQGAVTMKGSYDELMAGSDQFREMATLAAV